MRLRSTSTERMKTTPNIDSRLVIVPHNANKKSSVS
jgi:hypothetical protein